MALALHRCSWQGPGGGQTLTPGESSKFYSPKSIVSPPKKKNGGRKVLCRVFFLGGGSFFVLVGDWHLVFARLEPPDSLGMFSFITSCHPLMDSPRSNHWRLSTNCQLYTTNRHFWLCCMGQAHRSPLIGKKYSHLANPRSKHQE